MTFRIPSQSISRLVSHWSRHSIDLHFFPLGDAPGGQAEAWNLISPSWLPREEWITNISVPFLFYWLLTSLFSFCNYTWEAIYFIQNFSGSYRSVQMCFQRCQRSTGDGGSLVLWLFLRGSCYSSSLGLGCPFFCV